MRTKYRAQCVTVSAQQKLARPEPFCDTAPEQAPGNERAEQDTLPASRGGQRCRSLQSRPAEARRAPSSNSSGDSVHSEAQLPVHMLFLNPHLTLWPWVI